jgi:hypothetical protein
LSIWKAVIESRFSDGRINARKMALEQLCQMLTVFVNQCSLTHGTSGKDNMLPVLELLLTITQNSLVSNESYCHLYKVSIMFLGKLINKHVTIQDFNFPSQLLKLPHSVSHQMPGQI